MNDSKYTNLLNDPPGSYRSRGKLYGWTGKTCPHCKGTGEDNEAKACRSCAGTGEEYGEIKGN